MQPVVNGAVVEERHQFKHLRIFKADDLNIFHRINNRPLRERKVQRLMRSIQKKNMLADYPILVNHELGIIDGQHRWVAAQRLGLPLYYRFAQEGVEVADIALANANTDHWSWPDHLAVFMESGNKNYWRLDQLRRMTSARVPLQSIAALASTEGRRSTVAERFKEGTYEPDAFTFAALVLAEIEEVIAVVGEPARHSSFFSAYVACRHYAPSFDAKRFLRKVKKMTRGLGTGGRTIDALKDIERIYNYKVATADRIDLREELKNYMRTYKWIW